MKHQLHVKPSLLICATQGYFFCRDCRHVVQRKENELLPAGTCAECGSPRIHWHAPVVADPARAFLLNQPGKQRND